MVVSFIDEGNRSTRRKPLTCLKSRTNLITLYCIEYTSTWTGFELTNLVVIGTDCRASCKSNYHAITTTTAPVNKEAADQLHELFPPLAAASNNYNLRNSCIYFAFLSVIHWESVKYWIILRISPLSKYICWSFCIKEENVGKSLIARSKAFRAWIVHGK
jgi:hypothetical protein